MQPLLLARVMGAGPTGALAALALAQAGWSVSVHDPLGPEALRSRSRAYALTHSSRSLLRKLDLWDPLQPVLSGFHQLHLHDSGCGMGTTFTPADLGVRLTREPDASVGWILDHADLMAVLLERLATSPTIELHLGDRSRGVSRSDPDLVVAADGAHSPTRESVGIRVWQHAYRQHCLTAQVALRGAEGGEASELLRPEGPFAILPLASGHVQIVWSAPQARCRQLESLSPAAFLDDLAGALPDQLQPDALLDTPRSFPVSLLLARRLHRGATVLVGESAHRCHPVGGQGLNLCWRDVAVLQRLAERAALGRLDPARIGTAYGWRRGPDLWLTLLSTDLLVRIFSNRHPLLLPLRRLALLGLARLGPLRRITLGAMTHGPCRPWNRRP